MSVDADGKIILKRRSPAEKDFYFAQKIVALQRENTDMREVLEWYEDAKIDGGLQARACLARWPK